MITHKGYTGKFAVDLDAGVIRGRVVGIRDVITFQGATVQEARSAFVDSVEDYLAFCDERGEEPESPYSGRFVVKIGPRKHRLLAMEAAEAGVSFDSLIARKLVGADASTARNQ